MGRKLGVKTTGSITSPGSMSLENREQDLDDDQEDDQQLEEFGPEVVRLVRDDLVNALQYLELAPDPPSPFRQVEPRRHQPVYTRQVLVADQLEHVAGALEQAVGLRLQFPQSPQRAMVPAPGGQPRTRHPAQQVVGSGEDAVEALIDVAVLEQLEVGELDGLKRLLARALAIDEHGRAPVG